ncbi:MAG: hypothetical protein JNL69_01035 [Bacteroidia bacterium]|nr:hypothetical protein [Bacteroidia bacterium]
MKNLLLNSFIVILLSSCSLGQYGKLKKTASTPESIPHSIFGENFNSFLFKTNIRVYGKEYSGLLVTKQMEANDYRVIFTTELGMKLFDFQFKDTLFTLHYCVPQFNRAALLNTIQKDIEVLLMNNIKTHPSSSYIDSKQTQNITKIDFGKYQNYYFKNVQSKELVKIEQAKKSRKKTTFILSNYTDGFPNYILIKHHDIKLKIELNLLKK